MKYYLQQKKFFLVGIILFGINLATVKAETDPSGKWAPEWVVSEWINSEGFTLSEMRGKVVIIDFFQLWCPGCNSFSGPLMKKWSQKYIGQMDIQLVAIHTVFEGHSQQTPKLLRQYVKEKNITYPVGVDTQVSGRRLPETMMRYNTRGTPEMAIIDKKGRIRFQHFGSFNPDVIEGLIDTLLKEE